MAGRTVFVALASTNHRLALVPVQGSPVPDPVDCGNSRAPSSLPEEVGRYRALGAFMFHE
jgi:hypothetical protein